MKRREPFADLRSNCCSKVHAVVWADSRSSVRVSTARVCICYGYFFFINSHLPRAEHFKMATRCIAPPKWRLPSPIFRSITMAHAWHAHGPPTLSKPVSSAHKLRPPHSHTPFLLLPPSPPGREAAASLLVLAAAGSSPPCMPPSSRPVGSHPALHRLP